MQFNYNPGGLSGLLENKKLPEEQKRKIIITQEVIGLIHQALSTENTKHKLSEEMDNLESYITKIENVLK